MHTTSTLSSTDFSYLMNNNLATFDDIFPNFNENDRIGIIISEKGGSIGASALLMATITRFYDFFRPNLGNKTEETWIYPDYYVFHIGKQHFDHFWLDIWPPNKEVIIKEDDPEQILEAINDRAITRLIVEDREMKEGTFLKETLTSAKKRILSTIAYSPTGSINDGNIFVTSCKQVEEYIKQSIKRFNLSKKEQAELMKRREALNVNGKIIESYRKIKVEDALKMLSKLNIKSHKTKKYLSML